MIELVLGGLLLACLGVLIGASWATQATQSKLRRLAKERRRLNEEWAAIRAVRRQQTECFRCASPLREQSWYFTPTIVEDRPDNDCLVGR